MMPIIGESAREAVQGEADDFADDPLLAMWRDCEDMADAANYVRRLRRSVADGHRHGVIWQQWLLGCDAHSHGVSMSYAQCIGRSRREWKQCGADLSCTRRVEARAPKTCLTRRELLCIG